VTSITPTLDVCVHRDGAALWFAGEIVDVFPTLWGADRGWKAAREALLLLETTLAKPREQA
jgi:hypothetical protein